MINPPHPLPIVLDTDIGKDPDDLLALCMVLDRTDISDLRGVICTGKAPRIRASLVMHILEICGRTSIPVAIGREPRYGDEPSNFHLNYFRSRGANLNSEGFLRSEDILMGMSPSTVLITIGPLSTLADFMKGGADRVSSLGRVVSMGGYVSRRRQPPVREYNFGSDPDAARYVLQQDLDHICVGKNTCMGVTMLPQDVDRLDTHSNPARAWAFSFMKQWFMHNNRKIFFDPFTVAVALFPEMVHLFPVRYEVLDGQPYGKVLGIIQEEGKRLATVGGTPDDLSWFNDVFYGNALQEKLD